MLLCCPFMGSDHGMELSMKPTSNVQNYVAIKLDAYSILHSDPSLIIPLYAHFVFIKFWQTCSR
jgi:hypothetical protein